MDAIATLAGEGWSGPEFASRFLRLLDAGLPLDGGLVWRRTPAGWQVIAAVGLQQTEWFRQPALRTEQGDWLRQAGQGTAPWVVPSDRLQALGATSTEVVILIPSVEVMPVPCLVQVHLATGRLQEPLEATLAFLIDAVRQAGAAFEFAGTPTRNPVAAPPPVLVEPATERDSVTVVAQETVELAPAPWDLAGLLAVSQTLQRDLSLKAVALAAANDGRAWLNADRVSVWIKRRGRWRPDAISGQAQLHRHSPVVRAWKKTLPRLVATGRPFHAETDGAELPDALQQSLTELLLATGARDVWTFPLVPPEPVRLRTNSTAPPPRPRPRAPFAVVVLERLRDADLPSDWTERAAALADCVTLPLWNARRYERILLQPVWRGLGALWGWITEGRLVRTTVVVTLLIAAIVSLILVPWEYRVEGTGRLMPVERREVFAPQDAEVVEVLVRSGDPVIVGQPLVQLRSRELEQQAVARTKERDEQRQLLQSLRSQRDQAIRRADRDAEIRLQGQWIATQAVLEGLEREVQVLAERQTALQVVAPLAGTVATFEVDQLLRFRPVRRGEVLLSVMNEAGPWRLELDVQEARIGQVLVAQQRADQAAEKLTVDFLLVTQPEQSFTGTVDELATATTPDPQDGLMLQVHAHVDTGNLPQRRIGAEVRGRIRCGQQPLGYVLFGDVWEFLLRKTWWW